MSNKLKVLDLFSGLGGISHGLHMTGGFETVAFCEIDKHCHKVLQKNFPGVHIFTDIRTLTKKELGEAVSTDNKIDVICGGFPCQDLSVGGKKKGLINGERSKLWFEYLRLIGEIKPRWVIIENVDRLVTNGLETVLEGLSKEGYSCEWHIIQATHVGLPHRRERCYIIANSSSVGLYEHTWQERLIQANQKREIATAYSQGQECEPKSFEVCTLLSSRDFDLFRSSNPSIATALSSIHRTTNGIHTKLDEDRRKQRIKQLGNSVIPQISEVIGNKIWWVESWSRL